MPRWNRGCRLLLRLAACAAIAATAALPGAPSAMGAKAKMDSGKIAFERDGGSIYVLTVRTGALTNVSDTGNAYDDYSLRDSSPSWKPDGSRLVYSSYLGFDGDTLTETHETRIAHSDGFAEWALDSFTTGYAYGVDSQPDYSRDGTQFAYVGFGDAHDAEIWTRPANGEATHVRLTDNQAKDTQPDWSPDGTRIAFASDRSGGDYDIFVMEADGTNVEQLTAGSGNEVAPAWSPDGTQIAYAGWDGNDLEIYRMPAGGGSATQLTDNTRDDTTPAWSPDGSKIVFAGLILPNYYLYTMDADGGAHETTLAFDGSSQANPDWIPRGGW